MWGRYMQRFNDSVSRKANKVADLIFPPRCPLCEELLVGQGRVCETCRMKISYVQEPSCFRCGKEIMDEEAELCEVCTGRDFNYIRGFPAINYVEPMRESVARFKYHNCRTYAQFYADEIVRAKGKQILAVAPELLIPVPVHKKRFRKRGYNQAGLLAEALGKRLNIPVDTELLVRGSNTLPQKTLGASGRQANLNKAFQPGKNNVKYKRVMLVDDIYTTGATIEACAGVLRKMGCEEVYYTSVCIGKQVG